VLQIIAYVGGFSSLFAAVIAITQTDIKRVLAYSTMSQIGYMMLALGVSGYEGIEGLGYMASMFHLFTHAMFKALLFLCAGSVIHAVHSNYLKDMGGLRKYMPVTNITFLIAALAIAGIPPFSGFWSKDEILVAASGGNTVLYILGILVAGLTGLYIFRIYFSIFWGPLRNYKHVPKESPFSMAIPLIVLAILSISVGFIPFSQFISADRMGFEGNLNLSVAGIALLAGGLGIAFAWIIYKKENNLSARLANRFGVLYKWTYQKFYIDELYLLVTKNVLFGGVAAFAAWFDRYIVDGTMNSIGNSTVFISSKIKSIQSGRIQDYAMAFVGGAVLLSIVIIYLWTT
jgi:NADH-quinone oxidoreductase subunit L